MFFTSHLNIITTSLFPTPISLLQFWIILLRMDFKYENALLLLLECLTLLQNAVYYMYWIYVTLAVFFLMQKIFYKVQLAKLPEIYHITTSV